MAEIKLGDVTLSINPFKFVHLDAAGPDIDKMMGMVVDAKKATFAKVGEMSGMLFRIIAVGMADIDKLAEGTAEEIEAEIQKGVNQIRKLAGHSDMPALQSAFQSIMAEAGLTRSGESGGVSQPAAAAPAEETPEEPGDRCDPLSPSLSPGAAETGTES